MSNIGESDLGLISWRLHLSLERERKVRRRLPTANAVSANKFTKKRDGRTKLLFC